jgi:hypothetical protein
MVKWEKHYLKYPELATASFHIYLVDGGEALLAPMSKVVPNGHTLWSNYKKLGAEEN